MVAASRIARGGLLVAAALVAGCAHDLAGWKVARTPHFELYTSVKARAFESVLDRLEDVHAGLRSSLFSTDIPSTEVFLLDPTDFHELLGDWGGMAIGAVGRRGVLVLQEGWDPAFIDQTAAHELAHAFIGATFRAPPTWFNEGLATFAESIMVQEAAVLYGSNKVHVASGAAAGRLVKTHELFTAPATQFHGEWQHRHYTTAWAVIHYIWLGEGKRLRARFDAFGAALSYEGGRAGGTMRAWTAVFPEVPLADLDNRLLDHMNLAFSKGRDAVVGFRFTRPERPATVLVPADMAYVDRVRAQLRKYRRAEKL